MSVIQKLKSESMRLRKERSPFAKSIVFALSEVQNVGKNKGNRETTEDEAIKVVQKLLASLEVNINLTNDTQTKSMFAEEAKILESVLPQMVDEQEVADALTDRFKDNPPKHKGEVMKFAKETWGSLVDMKHVGSLADEILKWN